MPVSDVYPKSSKLKTSIHPSTIEKLSDISNSLPDTPLLGRCDFPRQFSATGTKTMSQMSSKSNQDQISICNHLNRELIYYICILQIV